MPDDFFGKWYYTDPLAIPEEQIDEFGIGELYRQLPDEVEKLKPYLQNQSEFVRETALQKLFHKGTEEQILTMVSAVLGDVQYPELDELLYLLSYADFKNVAQITELVEMYTGIWLASTQKDVIRAAIPLISKYAQHKHIRLLIVFLQSDEPLLRWQAYDSIKHALQSHKLNIQKLSQQEREILLKHFPELIPTEHPFEGWPSIAWRSMTLYIANTGARLSKGLQGVKKEQFENQAILFPHISAIHSYNCLFDFTALYLSHTGEVLARKTIAPNQNFIQGPQGTAHILEMNEAAAPELIEGQMLTELGGFFGEDKLAVRVAQLSELSATYSAFKEAVINNNVLEVKQLLDKDYDINARNALDWTILHYAIWKASFGMTRYLIEHGADVNAQSEVGETPLHWAVSESSLPIVRLLIDSGADPHIRSAHGVTALQQAKDRMYSIGNIAIIRYLTREMQQKEIDQEWRTSKKGQANKIQQQLEQLARHLDTIENGIRAYEPSFVISATREGSSGNQIHLCVWCGTVQYTDMLEQALKERSEDRGYNVVRSAGDPLKVCVFQKIYPEELFIDPSEWRTSKKGQVDDDVEEQEYWREQETKTSEEKMLDQRANRAMDEFIQDGYKGYHGPAYIPMRLTPLRPPGIARCVFVLSVNKHKNLQAWQQLNAKYIRKVLAKYGLELRPSLGYYSDTWPKTGGKRRKFGVTAIPGVVLSPEEQEEWRTSQEHIREDTKAIWVYSDSDFISSHEQDRLSDFITYQWHGKGARYMAYSVDENNRPYLHIEISQKFPKDYNNLMTALKLMGYDAKEEPIGLPDEEWRTSKKTESIQIAWS